MFVRTAAFTSSFHKELVKSRTMVNGIALDTRFVEFISLVKNSHHVCFVNYQSCDPPWVIDNPIRIAKMIPTIANTISGMSFIKILDSSAF